MAKPEKQHWEQTIFFIGRRTIDRRLAIADVLQTCRNAGLNQKCFKKHRNVFAAKSYAWAFCPWIYIVPEYSPIFVGFLADCPGSQSLDTLPRSNGSSVFCRIADSLFMARSVLIFLYCTARKGCMDATLAVQLYWCVDLRKSTSSHWCSHTKPMAVAGSDEQVFQVSVKHNRQYRMNRVRDLAPKYSTNVSLRRWGWWSRAYSPLRPKSI